MPARSSRLHRPVTATVTVLLLGLASCGGGGGGAEITIYSGRSEALIAPVLEDFAEATGIDVAVRYGDSVELALALEEQGDNAEADVFISQSPGPVSFLDNAEMLAPIAAETLDLVPEGARSPNGTWVGFSGRKRVLVYNTDNIDPAGLPDSILDLTAPEYEGRVAIAPTNASFEDWFTTFRAIDGDEAATAWLDAMVANKARSYANNRAIAEAVGRGEIDFGLVNHYYNYQLLEQLGEDQHAANHDLDDTDIGSLVLVASASILTTAGDDEAAQELLAYLLSGDAQRYFTDSSFEYPLVEGVEPLEGLPPLSGHQLTGADFAVLGDGLVQTKDIIAASGILDQ